MFWSKCIWCCEQKGVWEILLDKAVREGVSEEVTGVNHGGEKGYGKQWEQISKNGEVYPLWIAHAWNTLPGEVSDGIFSKKYTQCNYVMDSNHLGIEYNFF